MKLQLKCDKCGVVGTSEQITRWYDDDLCADCRHKAELADLKQRYANKKEWLENTHLKDLRELEKQIAELEQAENKDGG